MFRFSLTVGTFFLYLFCCSRRKKQKSRVGAPHRITKEDTQKWFIQEVCLQLRCLNLRPTPPLSCVL